MKKTECDPSRNDVTGDRIISKIRSQKNYEDGWDRIWGEPKQLESNFDVEPSNEESVSNGETGSDGGKV